METEGLRKRDVSISFWRANFYAIISVLPILIILFLLYSFIWDKPAISFNYPYWLFYLIGVAPEYQKKGVTAIIFDEYFKTYEKIGVKKCILTPELVDNKDIHLIWKSFNPKNHKKRCTYKLDI